ncbi:hypothetical protein [Flammeovirga sp. SJP92]|uniref:hypothetical protein n=1 Tax=Flammeovirga sp. SJP92 TaxID=1775430 RepID=UPI0007893E80|nr:hypothetical protein [Flammeovirga sp. SJP92]KXX70796.1 hypothetical protein AVL50_07095 [Flammeovirga sp. SJP92]
MKILNTPSKGLAVNTKDFEHMYNATKDVAEALASVLTESTAPVRIKGVEFTQNGNNFQCDEGWLLWQNTLYKVDAFNASGVGSEIPVFNLQTTKLTHEPHDLLEGYNKVGTFDFCTEEKLVPTFGARGAGLFDYDAIIKHPVKRNSDAIAGLQGLLPGMIVDYKGSLTNFTASGLGIGDFIGYALCNGQNNTPDLRGRVTIGMSDNAEADGNPDANLSEYFKMGNVGGSKDVTLTVDDIPPLSLPFSTTTTVSGITGGDDDNHDNTSYFAGGDKPTGEHPTFDINVDVSGNAVKSTGGDAHENRPPYMVVGKLMKL